MAQIDDFAKLMSLPESTRKLIVNTLIPQEVNAVLNEITKQMAWRLSNTGAAIDRSDYEDLLRFVQSRLKPVADEGN